MTQIDVKIVKMYYCGKHETPFSEHRQHQQSPLQLPKLQAVKAVWWESTCVWKQKEEAVVVGSILAKVTHFPNSIMNRLKWYNWCGRVYLIPINIPRHLYNNNNGSRKVFHLVFICSRRRSDGTISSPRMGWPHWTGEGTGGTKKCNCHFQLLSIVLEITNETI